EHGQGRGGETGSRACPCVADWPQSAHSHGPASRGAQMTVCATRQHRPVSHYGPLLLQVVTDGVSRLQTSESNSTFWPSCHGHALLPNWSKASPPTRHGGAHDHHRFYHRLILPGR